MKKLRLIAVQSQKKALLEDLVKRIDTIYQNLPSAEQVLEKLKEVEVSLPLKLE